MAELVWNLSRRIFTLLSTSVIGEEQASDTSASPAKESARLEGVDAADVKSSRSQNFPKIFEESTTGSLSIQSWTDPNVTSRGEMSGKASAPQTADRSRRGETVGPRDSSPQSLYANAAFQREPSTQDALTFSRKGNSKFGSDMPDMNTVVPYALTWTEHEMELRPVRSLKSSVEVGMTPSVFPRFGHSCTAIPNSSGEFVIFGGCVLPAKEEIWTNDVILLSTADMSLTSLETNDGKPKATVGHRAVIAGRVLVVFGGGINDNYLHFLNLDTREWLKLRPPAPYPGSRFGHSFVIVDNTIWLFGGILLANRMDDMWCIDLKTGMLWK
ncbi:hypothetical protein M407DRAFT_129608 [Tulasnella calospora MUT 4182]|uniref:Uncharacterized protein n=1 Tax=Tulasnella calospora MUT 4182 TaxID=1051891 RepID=A0A0C3QAQ6_9AGAM|nr:hypothetical protein M407DRAFT_129608 [Tulasnella calospora MUT 4182]